MEAIHKTQVVNDTRSPLSKAVGLPSFFVLMLFSYDFGRCIAILVYLDQLVVERRQLIPAAVTLRWV